MCVAHARIKESQGDLDGALDLLDQAERLYYRSPLPEVRPIAALKIRLWLAQGRLTEALGWVHERGLSATDNLSYLREFEHITLARVLIAQCKNEECKSGERKSDQQRSTCADSAIHEATELLARLLHAAEAGNRTGSVIQILLLQAIAVDMQDATDRALGSLTKALKLGKSEGYGRSFVDEGEAIVPLLRRVATQGVEPKYVTTLLQSFHRETPTRASAQPLIEPLSQRELELLALVSDGLSNQQISNELVISIATTKKHMSNILGKLSASNRTEAVRRARDLQLL